MGCDCPCFGFFKAKHKKQLSHEQKSKPASKSNLEMRNEVSASKGESNVPNSAPTFSYEELAIATNNFSSESFIGSGGFGSVYKGELKATGQVVAVKKLDPSGFQGDKEFLVEVLMLSLVHHPNLVNLIGFCAEGNQRLLVYEYMPLGSLEGHLFDLTPDMKPLDWNARMKIAAGTAKGLDCLHCANPPVIYRDLKSSNILLEESFEPKLSDLGLAKFGPSGDKSHVSTRVMGTYGYCAPEYAKTGKLTTKTDIYSFGIVLLELITGRRALQEVDGHTVDLTTWALPLMKDSSNYSKLADPLLKGRYSNSALKKAVEVAAFCLSKNVNLRPSSSDLVLAMDYLVSRKYVHKEHRESSVKRPEIETEMIMDKDLDRDDVVAEAKKWGESWREKSANDRLIVISSSAFRAPYYTGLPQPSEHPITQAYFFVHSYSWVNRIQHGQ